MQNLLRHKPPIHLKFSSKSDLIFIRKDFCHYCIELHSSQFRHAQFRLAVNLITVPIEFLHQIAKEISIPKIPIIGIANRGWCGATVITKMFEAVPNSLSMSEPNAYAELVELSRKGRLARSDLVKLWFRISFCILKLPEKVV